MNHTMERPRGGGLMTTANKLTIARILMVPLILAVLYWGFPGAEWAALALFIAASLTDLLDGFIARRCNQVTNFGKFMDPLADKMLTMTVMCWFVDSGNMAGWVLALVLLREFAVSGMRLLAAERGRVVSAAMSGKVKTFSSMAALCLMLVFHWTWLNALCQTVIVATTVYSGAEYLVKNRDVFLSNS